MDKRNLLGFGLIFILFYLWLLLNKPTPEEIEASKHRQDSLAHAEQVDMPAVQTADQTIDPIPLSGDQLLLQDSLKLIAAQNRLGIFASAARGSEEVVTLENDLIKIDFTTKGGRILRAELKDHKKIVRDTAGVDHKIPLFLLEDEKNKFSFGIPLGDGRTVQSDHLNFKSGLRGNTVTFTADAQTGGKITQTYTLAKDGYSVDYNIGFSNLGNHIGGDNSKIKFNWTNYLDKLERNHNYERNYSTTYFKEFDEDPDHCSCTGNDEEKPTTKIKWISNSNQFFNSTIISDQGFTGAVMTTETLDKEDGDLKKLSTSADITVTNFNQGNINMQWYIGPNEYDRLEAIGMDLTYIIPYGRSVFGTINRHIIRPAFNFLHGIIGNIGIAILILTLIIKFILYPLTYKMLYSQAKMAALKPKTAKLKEKYKDDAQLQQTESMKLYREYGVNPLGGCMPMILQMPIWFALYRFFPATIDFRQKPFLWATDLSSFEEFIRLPFEVPLNFGSHISLFAVLWALSVIWYSWYNSKHMDMGAMNNPMMKYMQYFMPLTFIIFFNSFASGLTLYMLFSSLLNIVQTVGTKKFVFNESKIQAELEEVKKKPKKKGGFSERLETVMKQQQEQQKKLESQKKKKSK